MPPPDEPADREPDAGPVAGDGDGLQVAGEGDGRQVAGDGDGLQVAGEGDAVDRDRDPQGRARNARPRDATGRPLPRGAREQLRAADEEAALPPAEALEVAQSLINDGRPFSAHEVLEAVWHVAPDDERRFWQGLAQVAVGLTHVQRGNALGASSLLRSGADKISRHLGDDHGVDLTGVVAVVDLLADRVEADGVSACTPEDLVVALRRKPA